MFYHFLWAFNGILSHDTKINEQLQWLKSRNKTKCTTKIVTCARGHSSYCHNVCMRK